MTKRTFVFPTLEPAPIAVLAPQLANSDSHRVERLRAVVRPIIRYRRGRQRGELDDAAVRAIWREINDAIEELWAGDCPVAGATEEE